MITIQLKYFRCKTNIVGRTCEKCKQGYWAFPHCQLCNCDLRGTTADICEEESARCHCKVSIQPNHICIKEVNNFRRF